ncbi:MAG: biotin transporter BioY [Simkaniaceae bacterium]|jgi:biotin transport system substrate-specific component|nr:MAG: biotin transporter BioY [Simkaniaceae bacterium]
MEVIVESTPVFSEKTKSHAWTATQVVLGSLFLAALAQVSIPLYPIPMTLQTLGIFLLAIGQGGKKASYSSLLYLALAAFGLPVLAGGVSNSLWIALPSAGYLIGFPIASFVIGKMVRMRENPSALWMMGSVLVGQLIIYTLGVAGLTRILSFEQSMMVGLVPFLPLAGVKLLMASSIGGFWIRFKKR